MARERRVDQPERDVEPRAKPADAHSDAPAAVSRQLLRLQRQVGNRAVANLAQAAADKPTSVQRHAHNGSLEEHGTVHAIEIDLGMGWLSGNSDKILRALSHTEPQVRTATAVEFGKRHGDLKTKLKKELGGDNLVNAAALLASGRTSDPHASMARSLIGLGTRDEEVLRLLEERPLAGRKTLQAAYDRDFGWVGDGSLIADLKDDLSGWRLQKALALLDRDLTSADHIYFESVAITGTRDDNVIRHIQDAWKGGPQQFTELLNQWDANVKSSSPEAKREKGWTKFDLKGAMDDELSGESWKLVKAVFEGYDRAQREGLAASGLEDDPAKQDALDVIKLEVAEKSLEAAYEDLGTNEAQAFSALETIREIYDQRIRRFEGIGNPTRAKELRAEWEKRRRELAAQLPEDMSEGSADMAKARLLLSGTLTKADEAYLAKLDLDDPKTIDVVTEAWQKGEMGEFLTHARQEKRDASGTLLRPPFDPMFLVSVNSGAPWYRVNRLVDPRRTDSERGAERIAYEISRGDSDSDLQKVYALLQGATDGLRVTTIETFVSSRAANAAGDTAAKKFIAHVRGIYKDSNACWDIADLVDPAPDAKTMAERARARHAASNTGLLSGVLNAAVGLYEISTGEYTTEATLESLARLEHISAKAGAAPHELEGMAAMAGVPVADLAAFEYDAFKSRLDELRALKRTVAEALATAVEFIAAAAITVLSGGAAAPLLVSLAAAVIGMGTRELLLGDDYDLVSKENAQKIIAAIATAGMQKFGAGLLAGAVTPAQLEALGRAGTFLQEAGKEAAGQVGSLLAAGMFAEKAPTAEEIAGKSIELLGSVAAAGTKGVMSSSITDLTPRAEKLRVNVGANISEKMISGMTEQLGGLASGGGSNLAGGEMVEDFAKAAGTAITTGFLDAVADAAAEKVGDDRAAAKDREDRAKLAPTSLAEAVGTSHESRQFDMVTNPGPLPALDGTMAGSFAGGRYDAVTLTSDTVLYRVGDSGGMKEGSQAGLGEYFTAQPTASVAHARIDSAVKDRWSKADEGPMKGDKKSPLRSSYKVMIPAGTTVYVGTVSTQGGYYAGGGVQLGVIKPWNLGAKVMSETPLPDADR